MATLESTIDVTDAREYKKHRIRETSKQFWLFSGGFLLAFAPYLAMVVLQSSIHIEEGIGTLSLGVAYAVSIVVALFITPIAVRRLGTHRVLVIGEFSYLIYLLANFYPKPYIMMAAGVVVGSGEALVWTALPTYFWHFGSEHGQCGSKPYEAYVIKYTGLFYLLYQVGQILGSSVSYGVLYGFKNKTEKVDAEQYIGLTDNFTHVPDVVAESHLQYQHCGSNDCQNPNMTSENIDSYAPADSVSLYTLISIFCLTSFCGTCIHFKILPRVTTKQPEEYLLEKNEKNESVQKIPSHSYATTLKQTFKHAINAKQILISPMLLYIGLYISFIYGEINRAYFSCVLGVEQMGLAVIAYAFVSGCAAAISPRIMARFGRNIVICFPCVVDLTNYIFCLYWRPEDDTKYLVFFIAVMAGLSDGIWKNCNIDFYTDYFPHHQEIAFTVWNFWITLGIAIAYLWSAHLCVYKKIYVQIGLLVFSMICYAVAEFIYHKEKRANEFHKEEMKSTTSRLLTSSEQE